MLQNIEIGFVFCHALFLFLHAELMSPLKNIGSTIGGNKTKVQINCHELCSCMIIIEKGIIFFSIDMMIRQQKLVRIQRPSLLLNQYDDKVLSLSALSYTCGIPFESLSLSLSLPRVFFGSRLHHATNCHGDWWVIISVNIK